MAKYKEYGYDIQDGKAIIPEWETEIKTLAPDAYVGALTGSDKKKYKAKCGQNTRKGI